VSDDDPIYDSDAVELDGVAAAAEDNSVAQPDEIQDRRDPRSRPSDPAGTQPKVDTRSLEPHAAYPQLTLVTVDAPGAPRAGVAGTVSAEHFPHDPQEEPPSANLRELPPPSAAADPPQALVRGASSATPGAPRFRLLYGVFGVVAVAVVALAVVLISRPGATAKLPWSTWVPSSIGGDVAEQIAAHVGPEYRLPDGHELVKVSGGPQDVQDNRWWWRCETRAAPHRPA